MIDPIEIQKAADASFFEDWREWGELGGWSQYVTYPIGKRRTNMPYYHCTLHDRVGQLDGAPAFEIAIPENIDCIRLIKAIPGAVRRPRHLVRAGPLQIWYVPAHRWQDLRKVLPRIKTIVTEICNR